MTSILVVVDRLSKYAHFGALPSSFDAPRVARLFVDMVIRHHGIPQEIISDRDPIFMSTFWSELFRLSGTHLKRSTAYHPQTDGQTEVVNRSLGNILRSLVHQNPKQWDLALAQVEFAYNDRPNRST